MGEQKRSCGECNLCCKIFKTAEVNQKTGHLCQHWQSGIGCSIYADRPPVCREVSCMWLIDTALPDDYKPDKSGVVIRLAEIQNGLKFADVREAVAGVLNSAQSQQVIRDLAEKGWFIMLNYRTDRNFYRTTFAYSETYFDQATARLLASTLPQNQLMEAP